MIIAAKYQINGQGWENHFLWIMNNHRIKSTFLDDSYRVTYRDLVGI